MRLYSVHVQRRDVVLYKERGKLVDRGGDGGRQAGKRARLLKGVGKLCDRVVIIERPRVVVVP